MLVEWSRSIAITIHFYTASSHKLLHIFCSTILSVLELLACWECNAIIHMWMRLIYLLSLQISCSSSLSTYYTTQSYYWYSQLHETLIDCYMCSAYYCISCYHMFDANNSFQRKVIYLLVPLPKFINLFMFTCAALLSWYNILQFTILSYYYYYWHCLLCHLCIYITLCISLSSSC